MFTKILEDLPSDTFDFWNRIWIVFDYKPFEDKVKFKPRKLVYQHPHNGKPGSLAQIYFLLRVKDNYEYRAGKKIFSNH